MCGGVLLGFLWLTSLFKPVVVAGSDGTVKQTQKISDTTGGLSAGLLGDDDRFGESVAGIGDVNGDGVPDALVGAAQDDDGGSNRGAVYVVFLNTNGTVKESQKISDLGDLDDEDFFGISVAGLGDVDGDGVPDAIVGAYKDDDGGSDRGAVYILFLNADGTAKNLQKIIGAGDQFGESVAGPGDIDGDGVPDALVGARKEDSGGTDKGCVFVLFLNTDGTVKQEQKINPNQGGLSTFVTLDTFDEFGDSVAGIGDIDGDGVPDALVGAYKDDDGGSNRGAVYVLFLNADGTVKNVQKISDTTGGLSASLTNADFFGGSTAGLGDIDSDGVPDVLVGARQDDDGGTNRGAVYVLFLNSNGTVKQEQKISDITGELSASLDDNDDFGRSSAGLGDIDGDGVPDAMVGAYKDDDGGSDRGAAYVLLLNGQTSTMTSTTTTTTHTSTTSTTTSMTSTTSTMTSMTSTTSTTSTGAQSSVVVEGSVTINHVVYHTLRNAPIIKTEFQNICVTVIADAAGTSQSNINIILSPGSVEVSYIITVPESVVDSIVESLITANESSYLATNLLSSLNAIESFDTVTSGSIFMSHFTVRIQATTTPGTDDDESLDTNILVAIVLSALLCCTGIFALYIWKRRAPVQHERDFSGVVIGRQESEKVTKDEIGRFTRDEFYNYIKHIDDQTGKAFALGFHFTDTSSLKKILDTRSHGLRASSGGQNGGGVSVCITWPSELSWEPFCGGQFRETVGRALWASKYEEVLLGGPHAGKLDNMLILQVSRDLLRNTEYRVAGRKDVMIIPPQGLVPADGELWFPQSRILRACFLTGTAKE